MSAKGSSVKKTDLKFTDFSPNWNDTMDVPFRIIGHKLRWLGARTSEDKFTRPYKVLRKSDLSDDLLRDLQDKNPNMFRDGDTIRHGDNVLGYCTNEAYNKMMERVKAESASQRDSIGRNSEYRPGVKIDNKETEVSRVGANQFNN